MQMIRLAIKTLKLTLHPLILKCQQIRWESQSRPTPQGVGLSRKF